MKKITMLSIIAAAMLFTGCEEKTTDTASDAVAQAAESTKEAVINAADATKEAVTEAATATQEAASEAIDNAK